MKKITSLQFDRHFDSYRPILEELIRTVTLNEIKDKNYIDNKYYISLVTQTNNYWHLAQDFRPVRYIHLWLRKELITADTLFDNLEKNYKDSELKSVKSLHANYLLSSVNRNVGNNLDELKTGTEEYVFYTKMRSKGINILRKLSKA